MSAMLQEFLQQQGYALCEYLGDGEFRLLAEPPEWFAQIWGAADAGKKKSLRLGDDSPFLGSFLTEAEAFWKSPVETGVAGVLSSGAWIEQSRAELGATREIPLEALALRMDGRRVLSLLSQPEAFAERTRVLQTARDGLLIHERLQKEVQKKEILLHCIIHDLSQPLTAMRGCFEVLALEGGSARSKKLLDIGRKQAEQQDEMIREVLKAFSADLREGLQPGGKAAEQPSLLTCAAETVTAFAPTFEAKGIKLQLKPSSDSRGGASESSQADGERDWKVAGEYSRLKRIFSNLVENALRYAPSGSVVSIGIEHDGAQLKAYVQDQGPGLPTDFKAADAFKLFAKGKEGAGKAGLGLYFCRITIERWGGTIGCESVAPRGTRFWFRLPAGKTGEDAKNQGEGLKPPGAMGVLPRVGTGSTEAPTRAERMERVAGQPPPQTRPSGLEVLLADDDAAIREVTVLLLKHQGFKVVAVDNGQDALRMLASRRFDIVLLDGEMPRLNGAETAQRIRATEKGGAKHQIILSLSGNNTEADQRRFREAGVDACLSSLLFQGSRKLVDRFPLHRRLTHRKRSLSPMTMAMPNCWRAWVATRNFYSA
ncbi:MAG: hybrid sensor histidine kinase/response regulator [Candidatus Acidiferrum sp.]